MKRGFKGISIFKSLHNYHYGTFIIIIYKPTRDPKRVPKYHQIATGESPSHTLGTTRLAWLRATIFCKGTLCAISLWAKFCFADVFSSKVLEGFVCARMLRLAGSLTSINQRSHPAAYDPYPYILGGLQSGTSLLQICLAGFWRGKIHTPARPTTCHALAPGAALTYNTANTGFTQARSLHGLCQQLLQLYTVSYS